MSGPCAYCGGTTDQKSFSGDWAHDGCPQQGATNGAPPPSVLDAIREIDWPTFWADTTSGEDWLVEPVIPRGRSVVVYAIKKTGKSLLAVEAGAGLATGRAVLLSEAVAPLHVVYVDNEMMWDDLKDRLIDFGYSPDSDLSRLHYYQHSELPPLDTNEGGRALTELTEHHSAQFVVVDTTSSTTQGPENDSDTIRNFHRYTGSRLKALRATVLRLDHAGKDPTRGQRGSSAKGDDPDLVWHFTEVIPEKQFRLRREASRMDWVPRSVDLERETEPLLRHTVVPAAEPDPEQVKEVIHKLDELGLPDQVGRQRVRQAFRELGMTAAANNVLAAAIKARKQRAPENDSQTGTGPGQVLKLSPRSESQ